MHSGLPVELYSAAQTRELDAHIIAAGTPGFELMQRAASAVWQALQTRWPATGRLTVLCGSGNNAGDGYLVASLAVQAGWQVRVLAVTPPERLTGDALRAWRVAAASGARILPWQPGLALDGVLVDALLGTGLAGPVREPFLQAIEAINASGLPVVAVDLPSGLDADRGIVHGGAVKADLTVTFIALKLGLFTAQGPDQLGQLVFAGLAELPDEAPLPLARRLVLGDWAGTLAARPLSAHKGLFGHLLLVGGGPGMGGAIMLAAETALRSGAGRVSVATRSEHVAPLLARCPEIMVHAVDDPDAVASLLEQATALVLGPGLGRSEWADALLERVLAAELPRVLDADALNAIAQRYPDGLALGQQTVITPHPAEAARLLGVDTAEVQADRMQAVTRLVERFGCAVVLKGVGSLVAGPPDYPGLTGLCSDGNPGMASAGMGDVLSGLTGALLAQQVDAGRSARYAVLVHALAGDRAAADGQLGILAGDLAAPIRYLLNWREQ